MQTNQSDFIAAIKEHHPDLENENIKIFDHGWDYIVYLVNEKQAFRFPRRKDYSQTLPKEVAFLNMFSKQSPVQVPKLTLLKMPNGNPYVIYPFIQGVPLKRDVAQSFNEQELQGVAKQIGNFLFALHSFSLKTAKALGIKELDSVNEWSNRLNKIKSIVYPHISESEQAWTTELFTNFIEVITQNPFKNRLIHSDIMPEHMIVDPKTHKLNGIIDFGDIEIADPAYDFTFLRKYGQKFLDTAYDNYPLDRDESFEKRRQFYEDRLVVTNLEHSLEARDKEKIRLHKEQLTNYIASNLNTPSYKI